jgi:transposase-like protein
MIKTEKTVQEQEAIIAEYLLGATTYRKLGAKHDVDFRVIHHWVARFQGKPVRKIKPKNKTEDIPKEELPTDVKQLREELRKAKLHNKLLNAIIDIA